MSTTGQCGLGNFLLWQNPHKYANFIKNKKSRSVNLKPVIILFINDSLNILETRIFWAFVFEINHTNCK